MTTRIDPDVLRGCLTTKTLGSSVFYREKTGSTNQDAKELGRLGAPHGALALCGRQTAGRGRRGRSWISGEGALCMSLLLRPAFALEFAPRYVIATALGVCRALRSFGANALIKWPNDILAGGRKLCGILLEADPSGFVVAGIGVNVNQRDFPADIADTADSLMTVTGVESDPNEVAARILGECEPLFEACGGEAGYAELLENYKALSLTLGSRVRVCAPDEEYFGTALSLDALGRLVVARGGGAVATVGAGDVSIRDDI